jgi:hypothetical protein
MKAKRAQARKKGGLNKRKNHRGSVSIHKIQKYQDIQKVLEIAINDVCSWEDGERRARTIGYLCKIAVDIQPRAETEEELEDLDNLCETR